MYEYQIQYLWNCIVQITTQVNQLIEENNQLKEQIDQIKPMQIDKIEYKIHELRVDTLSGTLNIGLTATGEDGTMGEIVEKMIDNQSNQVTIGEDEDDQQSTHSDPTP
ncbi:hypothetical protein IC620_15750 [Hazenella sp. IB182357]|uniref:Spore germination protein GerPC n=1 Tax=Polycladospora coralii TaxID=2771432 RepID=A0A926RV52_9BACL|nr:spore germination protein GerPC [Polycladospora coralii]MBD1373798.1 hypothetical protein [Polycladospora coralii]MBS7531550.1 hypothetical protein [Polycladospora coralii]